MPKIYSFEYVKKRIEFYGYKVISKKNDYKNGDSKIKFKDKNGYLYESNHNSFSNTIRNGKPLVFGIYNKHSIYNVQLWLNEHNRNWKVISRNIFNGRTGVFLFHCLDCGNNFNMRFSSIRNMDCRCPYCQRRKVSSINSISKNFPELIQYFDFDKNYPKPLEDVSWGSSKKYWWKCDICGYKWFDSPNNMIRSKKARKCGVCFGKIPSNKNKIVILYPELLKEWDFDKNIDVDVNKITYGSSKRVWWICKKCGYSYLAQVGDRVRNRHGCASCSGRILTDRNRLSILFPKIAEEWDYVKNKKLPGDFSFGSHAKVWWICSICNSSYTCNISNRVHEKGCPICNLSGKAQKIFKILKIKKLDFQTEYWFDDLKSDLNKPLKYDFAIFSKEPKVKYLIEYDGAQHTKYIPFWHKNIDDFKYRKILDKRKSDYAKSRNIPLLRITYRDKNIDEILEGFLQN